MPLGSADLPHTFTYVPDLAAAMIRTAQLPELWNSVLHAPSNPALTQRELAAQFAAAAGVRAPRMTAIPGWVVRGAGLVLADMREMTELLYQFQAPFVMDSTESQSLLGLAPTPLAAAAEATIRWWRDEA